MSAKSAIRSPITPPRANSPGRSDLARAPLHLAHRAARGAGGKRSVGLKRGRDVALAADRLPGGIALRLFGGATLGQLVVGDLEGDAAVRDVNGDAIAGPHQTDVAAFGRFRRQMADRQARRAAREASVGDERAGFAEAHRFQIAGRIQHLLHAGAAARAFIDDDHDLAGNDLAAQNAFHGRVLAFEHAGRACEFQDRGVDAGGLYDAAVLREIAVEHGETAVLAEGVFEVTDHALLAVGIELVVATLLAEGDLGRDAAGRGPEEGADGFALRALDVPALQRVVYGRRVHGRDRGVDQAGAVELAQNAHDAAGTMHVLDMHVGNRRRDLAQHGHAARQPIDVLHGERDLA